MLRLGAQIVDNHPVRPSHPVDVSIGFSVQPSSSSVQCALAAFRTMVNEAAASDEDLASALDAVEREDRA